MGRILSSIETTYTPTWEKERFTKRPVWEYNTMNAVAANMFRAVYSADDSINVLELSQLGSQSSSRNRGWLRGADEAAQTHPIVGVTTANPINSSTWAPNLARWGIGGWGNTASCNNWYTSTLEYGYIDGTDSALVMRHSGIVLLPENENQNFELTLAGYTVKNLPIGATAAAHLNSPAFPGIELDTLTGFNAEGLNPKNNGMMCYNARSGSFVAVYRIGTTGSDYRIHVIPIGKGLRFDTSFNDMKKLFIEGMDNYFYRDVTLAEHTNTGDTEDNAGLQVIACDDGSAWLVLTDTNNNTTGGQGLRVFKIESLSDLPSQSTLNQAVQSATHGGHYGLHTGNYYKTRHMVSDDNSVVAVYTHYYYYLPGAVGRLLSSASVNDPRVKMNGFSYALPNGYGFSIAPAGGSKFVMCYADNKDAAIARLWFLDPEHSFTDDTEVHTEYTAIVRGGYPQRPDSTMYQGQYVCKIQNLSRFKED